MRYTIILFTIAILASAGTANAQPDSLWSRTFGGRGTEYCYSIIQTADRGYTLAGFTESFGAGGRDMWLVRTDADGDSLWSRTFGGETWDECYSIIQTADGGYALAGYTQSFGVSSDMWLVRTDADGDSLWSRTFGGRDNDWCYSIIPTEDGGYVLSGYAEYFDPWDSDMWLVKTGPDPVSVPPDPFILHPSSFILYPPHPNPFNSTTTIRYGLPYPSNVSLHVYNLSGQRITTLFEGYRQAGFHSANLNAGDLVSGLYMIRLETPERAFSRRVILVK